jgi:hypothetical protein
VRANGEDPTSWLEYTAKGVAQTLEGVWKRIQLLSAEAKGKRLVLRPRQEEVLRLLRERGSVPPRELWKALVYLSKAQWISCGRSWMLVWFGAWGP